jgi:acid phosphatase
MRKLLIAALVLSAACASQPMNTAPASAATTPAPCAPQHALVNSTLWMQTSAEYDASALQTYASARRMLDAALSDPTWTAATEQTAPATLLPPAIILDLDETAIDNSVYEARGIRSGKPFTDAQWQGWVDEGSATAVPGVLEFLAYARSRGVTPFYITNRTGAQEAGTRRNLERLGFPLSASDDTLLTKAERPEWAASDKSARRAYVASKYRVLLLFGDDLNDFAFAAGKSLEERDTIIRNTTQHWGTRWFILPNPNYGSWEKSALGNTNSSGCEQLQKKIDALRP